MRRSTIDAFFETASRIPAQPAHLVRIARGRWASLSWSDAAASVRRIARALIAQGVERGDRVALCGPNSAEWLHGYLGALAAGAVPAPYYPTLPAEQAAYVVGHSEASVALLGEPAQHAKLEPLRERLPHLRTVVLMRGSAEGALAWDAFLHNSDAVAAAKVDERIESIERGSLATLVYTSGTTGHPKAAMISHGNLLFSADLVTRLVPPQPGDVVVSYLPLNHIAEQIVSLHAACTCGYAVACCERIEDLPEVLREIRPTTFLGVPRVWEKIQARIESELSKAPPRRQRVFRWAQRLGAAAAEGRRPLLLPVARRLVHAKVRREIGLDRARRLGTAAAPIARSTLDFFDSIGMPLLEIYGQTECTGASTSNLPASRKSGTVGTALPETEVKIAPDGEILLRGPHVFLGYFKDPEATAEALAPDGWLRTGDVGDLDRDGFLRITDRKKDLIITSGGKNIAPQNIEKMLCSIPGVAQAVVVGDARRHLAALLTLDRDAALREARACGAQGRTIEEVAADPLFVARVGEAIERINEQLASYETIKRFRLLPVEFSVESGELTPTLKIRRKVVNQRYSREIDEMFREGAAA